MAEESTIQSKRNSLYIKAIIGELLIFLIFSVMLFFYYKSKDKNILIDAIVLFIYLQTILLGVLYTYYYEIKNNSKVDNYRFNRDRGGNLFLGFIGILLILTCLFMYIKSMSYIIYMMISLIFLFIYIKTYREFIGN